MMPKLLILSETLRRALDLPQVVNITDQLPRHPTKVWPQRNFDLLQGITVHHFASEAPLKNQALYHVNAHGWAGVAYIIVIRDGQILQTNYLDKRTSHASGGNDISIGVCIGGDLSKRQMTDFERRALTGVCIALKELKEKMWVKGHKEIVGSRTSCPCTDVNRIRSDILSAEEELSFQSATAALKADSYKLAMRLGDLLSKLNHPTWGNESRRKLLLLKNVVDGSPDVIANTVINLYKSVSADNFVGENAESLALVVAEAKKAKLI